jgi:serine/threonine protein kinase/Tfp pilus assembly protein PilF
VQELADTVVADRYVLVQELGRGGMATVWRARDLRHERLVAVKILHPELASAIGVERFVREVRLTARLQHPNIVPVLDSGVLAASGGTSLPWYAMTYLAGETLRARLAREYQLPIEQALQITEAVADALLAAHQQGILHRDIKPENVVLADGRTYVVDFGIAKALHETGGERLTSTGVSIGTPAYMSPEQTSGREIDARSDQYSLATLLYEMLTGEPPFAGNAQAIMARRLTERARPVRNVRSTVPELVERAVLRALERSPADRFPDIAAFAAALRIRGSIDAGSSAAPRASRRWRAIAAAGLLVVVVLSTWLRFSRAVGVHRGANDPAVNALYQRGLRGYDKRTTAGTLDAIAAFNAAVARDSTFSLAWNGLADTYLRAYDRPFPIAGISQDSVLRLALSSVEHALSADSGSGHAWLTKALLSRSVDPTDNGPMIRSLRRALALDSTNARVWHSLAIGLAENGDFAGALSAWRRCVTLDPSYTQGVAFLGLGHYWRRQYDSAAKWADSALALDPNYLLGRSSVGYVAVERGDYDRGIAAFEASRRLTSDVEALNSIAGAAFAEARAGRGSAARARLHEAELKAKAFSPTPLHTAVYMAQAYAALGEAEHAVEWLARFQPRAHMHFQLHLRCDPPFDSIRSDQRFRSLLTVLASSSGTGC